MKKSFFQILGIALLVACVRAEDYGHATSYSQLTQHVGHAAAPLISGHSGGLALGGGYSSGLSLGSHGGYSGLSLGSYGGYAAAPAIHAAPLVHAAPIAYKAAPIAIKQVEQYVSKIFRFEFNYCLSNN